MSSWKNAAKAGQQIHRERSQPRARRNLGPLEKAKDYRVRAKEHSRREKTLKLLQKRALDKNPDEFYHHMINSRVIREKHHEVKKNEEHTPQQAKLMATQDLRYINMKRTIETRSIERMQSRLHMIDAANKVANKHTFFVDDPSELKNFNLAERLGTDESLLGNKTNRLRLKDLETIQLPEIDDRAAKSITVARNKSYKELAKRVEREKQLTIVQQKLELKRNLQDKNAKKPKMIKAATKDTAAVYKWKYVRKG